MNPADTLLRLLRRWPILLAGLVFAAGAAAGAWFTVPPHFERSSTQVLLPGRASLPERSQNPYLYIGGLTMAADVVVRAVGSENVANEIQRDYPGVGVEIRRDPTTSGPVILTTVSALSDDQAATVLTVLAKRAETVLAELQQQESIPAAERMSIVTLTIDDHSTLKDRTRLLVSVAAGIGIAGLSVLAAAIVEGLASRRAARRAAPSSEPSD
jgi:hypothetical protein